MAQVYMREEHVHLNTYLSRVEYSVECRIQKNEGNREACAWVTFLIPYIESKQRCLKLQRNVVKNIVYAVIRIESSDIRILNSMSA